MRQPSRRDKKGVKKQIRDHVGSDRWHGAARFFLN